MPSFMKHFPLLPGELLLPLLPPGSVCLDLLLPGSVCLDLLPSGTVCLDLGPPGSVCLDLLPPGCVCLNPSLTTTWFCLSGCSRFSIQKTRATQVRSKNRISLRYLFLRQIKFQKAQKIEKQKLSPRIKKTKTH